MEYRRLGHSGLLISAVGLGANNFGAGYGFGTGEADTFRVLDQALESGINFIDTANSYKGSEDLIGKWLKGKRRQDFIIATKWGMQTRPGAYGSGSSRLHILQEVEASLRRLGVDYIDLYQQHQWDPGTPIEETLRALDDLVSQGKVRYVGSSNFAGWKVAHAQWTAKTSGTAAYISEQTHYSLLWRDPEKEVLPACSAYGIGIIPFSPLEGGLLTGKYKRTGTAPEGTRLALLAGAARERRFNAHNFDRIEKLEALAGQHGRGLGELAIAWLLANPLVASVIAGATKPEQVIGNVKAGDWRLTTEDLTEIDAIAPVG